MSDECVSLCSALLPGLTPEPADSALTPCACGGGAGGGPEEEPGGSPSIASCSLSSNPRSSGTWPLVYFLYILTALAMKKSFSLLVPACQ